jgi:hypothetical protein
MNRSDKMTARTQGKQPAATSSMEASAYEATRRAMFSAASRVLSYHAAALDAKVARFNHDSVPSASYMQSQDVQLQR